MTADAVALASLQRRCREQWQVLGVDEMRVVATVVEALIAGRDIYGELVIADDLRNFDAEGDQERTDMLIYRAIAALKRGE